MAALSITILVCAAAMPRTECSADTAIAVVRPSTALYAEYSGLAGCLSFSERYIASLSYMDDGAAYPKILCHLGAPKRSVG